MQKKFLLLLLVAIVLTSFALLNAGTSCGTEPCKFVDKNKDGLCDNCKTCKESDGKDSCKTNSKDGCKTDSKDKCGIAKADCHTVPKTECPAIPKTGCGSKSGCGK